MEPFLTERSHALPLYYEISIAPMISLMLTIMLEISGTLLLRHSIDDYRFVAGAYACYFTGLTIFSFILRYIPLSIAYTTWCALGTIGVSIMSQLLFNEYISIYKWACICGTIPCMIGLYVLP